MWGVGIFLKVIPVCVLTYDDFIRNLIDNFLENYKQVLITVQPYTPFMFEVLRLFSFISVLS